MKKYLLLFIIPGFVLFSCQKDAEQYSIVPEINFKEFKKVPTGDGTKDSIIVVSIDFKDGDGDIGEGQDDNSGTPSNNFFMKLFEKKNGVYKAFRSNFPLNYRVPNVTPTGSHKGISGIISIDVSQFPVDSVTHKTYTDTVRYEIFITDRALHQSNTITTPDVIINPR